MQVPSPDLEHPLEEEMATASVFFPRESHGQRSLVGYNLWGHKESDTVVATYHALLSRGFPGGSVVKNPPANAGDLDSMPELGGSPGEGNDNPLKYFCLRNPMVRVV